MHWVDQITVHWGWGACGGILLAGLTLCCTLSNPFLVMGMFLLGVVFGAIGPKKPFFRFLSTKLAALRFRSAA